MLEQIGGGELEAITRIAQIAIKALA